MREVFLRVCELRALRVDWFLKPQGPQEGLRSAWGRVGKGFHGPVNCMKSAVMGVRSEP